MQKEAAYGGVLFFFLVNRGVVVKGSVICSRLPTNGAGGASERYYGIDGSELAYVGVIRLPGYAQTWTSGCSHTQYK